jgi:Uma2 family endonuclease
VRLPKQNEVDEQVDTVVEPDIVVVCDKTKLDRKGCRGAPDWVVEVLSPSTGVHDMNTKRDLYERHGIREYWIIHPDECWVMVYTLSVQGTYGKPAVFDMEAPTAVSLFPELTIDWSFVQDV